MYYYILTFSTTRDAMAGEAYARGRIRTAVMPLPREISSGCGLALRFPESREAEILDFCKTVPFPCTLWQMDTQRTNGRHDITKLYEYPG